MSFVPSACDRCRDITLVAGEGGGADQARCRTCGGEVSILPGHRYTARDVPLFDEICAIIVQSSLIGVKAQHLALVAGERARLYGAQVALDVLTFWIRGLEPLRPAFAASASTARLVCAMANDVLMARALLRDSQTFFTPPRRHALHPKSRRS